MSLATVFKEEQDSKVHFSEYIVRAHDEEGDAQPPDPHNPEQPEAV